MKRAFSLLNAVSIVLMCAVSNVAAINLRSDAASSKEAEAEERQGVTPTEITIGSCASLTGQLKERGQQVTAGGKAYFAYINDNGGVDGRKIKFVTNDDKYTAEGAESCFYSCLKDKVFAGADFQGTPTAARYVVKAELAHIPMVGFSTGAEFLVNPVHPYIFQVRPSYKDEAVEQLAMLVNKLHLKKIAIVYQDDAYGAACRTALAEEMTRKDIHPVAEISIPRLTHDVESAVKQLKAAQPDAVIPAVTGDALALLVKRRKEIGEHVQVMCFSPATDLLVKEAGQEADGTLITEAVPFLLKDAPAVKLHNKVIQQYSGLPPSVSTFEGFLIAMVVVEGLKRAGKDLTRDNFVKALESIHEFDIGLGPNYKISYGPHRHDALRGNIIMATIKQGKSERVTEAPVSKKAE